MILYKIKHIPTGLYYTPYKMVKVKFNQDPIIQYNKYVKSNLSKKGKLYTVKPTFSWYENLYSHIEFPGTVQSRAYNVLYFCKTVPEDWQVKVYAFPEDESGVDDEQA